MVSSIVSAGEVMQHSYRNFYPGEEAASQCHAECHVVLHERRQDLGRAIRPAAYQRCQLRWNEFHSGVRSDQGRPRPNGRHQLLPVYPVLLSHGKHHTQAGTRNCLGVCCPCLARCGSPRHHPLRYQPCTQSLRHQLCELRDWSEASARPQHLEVPADGQ